MTEGDELRLEPIERRLAELTGRVERMERLAAPPAEARRESPVRPVPPLDRPLPPSRPAPVWEPQPPQRGFEELFGGRVLGWVGGVAIMLGIVFLMGIAIDHGWIGEQARTMLAFLGSTLLLVGGVWLHERRGRTEAALAAVASALSGLYVTLLVATQAYELIPAAAGLACGGLVGVAGAAIAVRWRSTVVAAIGVLGALLTPVLVGAGTSWLSLAFMAIALIAAVAVLLWRRWGWLTLGAFLVSAPQLLLWFAANYEHRLEATLGVLAGFWALYVVAALGYELRARGSDELPVASWLLLLANAGLIAGAGYFALDRAGHPHAAAAWIAALAGAHLLLGAFALRRVINPETGSLLIALGLGLTAFAFSDVLDGPALVVGWAAMAVVLAHLATRVSRKPELFGSNAERLLVAAGAFLALALGHALAFEAPPNAILDGVEHIGEAIVALGVCAVAALYGRFALREAFPEAARACEVLGAAVLLYLASVGIVDTVGVTGSGESRQWGQVLLSAFWTLSGLGAVVYGLLRDVRRFRLGGLALLGLAIVKVYTYDLAELEELARVLSFIALGPLLLAGAFAYQRGYGSSG